jgi:hypothetical protein
VLGSRTLFLSNATSINAVANDLKQVAKRPGVEAFGYVNQTELGEDPGQLARIVASKVSGHNVHRREPTRVRRHRQQQRATGLDHLDPLGNCGLIILNVLKHLERAHQIKGAVATKRLRCALDNGAPEPRNRLMRGLE